MTMDWQDALQEAIHEPDPQIMDEKIRAAEREIFARMQDSSSGLDSLEEQALFDAQEAVRILRSARRLSKIVLAGESMNRFDVFRKQNDHFIKWVGTAESLEDLEQLIRTDFGNESEDDYVIYRSALGDTEVFNKPLRETGLRIVIMGCDGT